MLELTAPHDRECGPAVHEDHQRPVRRPACEIGRLVPVGANGVRGDLHQRGRIAGTRYVLSRPAGSGQYMRSVTRNGPAGREASCLIAGRRIGLDRDVDRTVRVTLEVRVAQRVAADRVRHQIVVGRVERERPEGARGRKLRAIEMHCVTALARERGAVRVDARFRINRIFGEVRGEQRLRDERAIGVVRAEPPGVRRPPPAVDVRHPRRVVPVEQRARVAQPVVERCAVPASSGASNGAPARRRSREPSTIGRSLARGGFFSSAAARRGKNTPAGMAATSDGGVGPVGMFGSRKIAARRLVRRVAETAERRDAVLLLDGGDRFGRIVGQRARARQDPDVVRRRAHDALAGDRGPFQSARRARSSPGDEFAMRGVGSRITSVHASITCATK